MFISVLLAGDVLAEKEKFTKKVMTKKQIKEKLLSGSLLVTDDVIEVKKIKAVIKSLKKKNHRERIVYQYFKRAEHYYLQSNSSTYPANRKNHLKLARILISIADDCSGEFPEINKKAKNLRESLR